MMPQTLMTVYDSIEMIGKATGKEEEAETLVADMKAKVEEVKAKASRSRLKIRKVSMLKFSESPDIMAAGKNTFIDEMLTTVQC